MLCAASALLFMRALQSRLWLLARPEFRARLRTCESEDEEELVRVSVSISELACEQTEVRRRTASCSEPGVSGKLTWDSRVFRPYVWDSDVSRGG